MGPIISGSGVEMFFYYLPKALNDLNIWIRSDWVRIGQIGLDYVFK